MIIVHYQLTNCTCKKKNKVKKNNKKKEIKKEVTKEVTSLCRAYFTLFFGSFVYFGEGKVGSTTLSTALE